MDRLRSSTLAPLVASLLALGPGDAAAATLPPHEPLRILVVGDAVNPHNLPADQLTEPADLRAALAAPQGGLNLDGGDAAVTLVDSQCVDQALSLLGGGTLDVVVYFAHQAARACDTSDAQPALTAAFSQHLVGGGGIVVFHHGIYEAPGKDAVLQLLGGVASSIQWDTVVGQRIINTAADHFVSSNGVTYADKLAYADPGHGVPAADYDSFVNLPDERYPSLDLLTAPGEARTILFASDYDGGGTNMHVLGYELQRPGWAGRVVFLQPGEYQPLILDLAGNPFQVLANAVVHVAGALIEGETGSTGGSSSGGPDTGSDASTSTGVSGGSETSGVPDPPTGGAVTTGAGTSDGPGGSTGAALTDTTATATATATATTTTSEETPGEAGCACSGPQRGAPGLLALAAVAALGRRRRR